VIGRAAFPIEPWTIHETELQLDALAQTESLFALANGHLGMRGNFDEGEPAGLPGTYLGGFFESRELPYAEAGFGYPEAGQTVVNVTNGKIIRLFVEDEPFDLRYGRLHHHERVLDLRQGVLRRCVEWESPTGRRVRIRSTRVVSFTHRAVAAIQYDVEPVDETVPVVIQSELIANEALPEISGDPRAAAALGPPLHSEFSASLDTRAILVHSTKESQLTVAAAMGHLCDGPDDVAISSDVTDDLARVMFSCELAPGERIRLTKYLAYGWSARRSVAALGDQVAAALAGAKATGWEDLLASQREYLDEFWDRADVEVEGDAELQQAVRFGLFHTLQAGARGEQRAIAAKGLTGPGYDGHTFWDTESFVLPVLTFTVPRAAADALRWRHRTLELARERAKVLGLRGASFPWRTIAGEECSSYWPAGTAAFHINADIANAALQYLGACPDEDFERDVAVELLVETARLWRSLGHHDSAGRFRIDGVTGPDEYSAVADNNVYTNLMAQRNLAAAAELAERNPEKARELEVDDEEAASWRDAAQAMLIPFDDELGVHPQAEGFTEHRVWDFEDTPAENYPLLLHYPYFDLYRKQVVKQADLVLAMQVCGEAFSAQEKVRNFDYYERITVRDSSLSACTQAVMAAEVGQLELAYDYFAEAALLDLEDLEHNTRDGVHIAALTGAWVAAVAGFGGMRHSGETLSFAPRLPSALTGLSFRLLFRGRRILIRIGHNEATYSLREGEPLEIVHHGRRLTLRPDRSTKRKIPPVTAAERPRQPPGRVPARRHRDPSERRR
jgi:alpha,alpha-trehalose phosphorylase